jgi:hypothetical protein
MLVIAIALYVSVVEMAYFGGYLEANRVVGVVRFSLKQPTKNNCDFTAYNCTNSFESLKKLPYCQQSLSYRSQETEVISTYPGSVYPCQIYEAVNAQVIRESSMVVWTRASTKHQSLICGGGQEMTCPRNYETASDEGPFYIADVESFTVLLEHVATASHICESRQQISHSSEPHYTCSAQASVFPTAGRLSSLNEKLCQQEFNANNNSFTQPHGNQRQSHAPCYIGANRTNHGQDFFSLHVILQASGISLDDCIDNQNDSCITYRESGATFLITVVWNDFLPLHGLIEPFYFYKTDIIGTTYKETQAFYEKYRDSRTLLNAHGIKVAVVTAGNFHQFTWLNFFITITTALGMLAVATAMVDACMLYVLPEKKRYHKVKYETIPQESDYSPFSSLASEPDGDDEELQDSSGLSNPLLPTTTIVSQVHVDETLIGL